MRCLFANVTVFATSLLACAPWAAGQLLFDEAFEAETQEQRSDLQDRFNTQGFGEWGFDWGIDYSNFTIEPDPTSNAFNINVSIPPAPNSQQGESRGVLLHTNRDISTFGQRSFAAIFPKIDNVLLGLEPDNQDDVVPGVTYVPNHVVRFDAWHNTGTGVLLPDPEGGDPILSLRGSPTHQVAGLNFDSDQLLRLDTINNHVTEGQGVALAMTADDRTILDNIFPIYGGKYYLDRPSFFNTDDRHYGDPDNFESTEVITGPTLAKLFEFKQWPQTYGLPGTAQEQFYGELFPELTGPQPVTFANGTSEGIELAEQDTVGPAFPYNRWAQHELSFIQRDVEPGEDDEGASGIETVFTYMINGNVILQQIIDSADGLSDIQSRGFTTAEVFDEETETFVEERIDPSNAGQAVIALWNDLSTQSESPAGSSFLLIDNLEIEGLGSDAEVPADFDVQAHIADITNDGIVDGDDIAALRAAIPTTNDELPAYRRVPGQPDVPDNAVLLAFDFEGIDNIDQVWESFSRLVFAVNFDGELIESPDDPSGTGFLTQTEVWVLINENDVNALVNNVIEAIETAPGDANFDLVVDAFDFALLAANFNQPGGWEQGDFNGDGVVDAFDFALLASNFNQTFGPQLPPALPEPATGLGLALGALLAARRRRA